MKCRYCNCTDAKACEGGCCWVAPGVCSRCAHQKLKEMDQARAEGVYVPRELLQRMLTGIAAGFTFVNEVDGDGPPTQIHEDITAAIAFYQYCAASRLVPAVQEVCPELQPVDPNQPPRLWKPGDPQ